MLSLVIGLSARARLRALARRTLRFAAAGALGLGAALSAQPSSAQPADRGGWFDPPTAGPADPEPRLSGVPPVSSAPPAPAPEPEVGDSDPSALTTFRPALDPYGTWVADPKFGTVWVPHREAVGEDFAPYVSRGRWALTDDDDWIWVSDYPFGWAVFHYGRWVWIGGRGWSWVPGRTYANAWVVWRVPTSGYAYVGWAPMPPSWVWMNGYAVSLHYGLPVPYVFCSSAYVFNHHVHRHIVHDRRLVRSIAANTRVHATPYRAPARPTRHSAASPTSSLRTLATPSLAPRGPRLSAARVPAQAVPERRAMPAEATRLAPRRAPSAPSAPSLAPPKPANRASERAPERARPPASTEVIRRDASVPAGTPRERSAAPVRLPPERHTPPPRLRAEPHAPAPSRLRPAPSPPRNSAPAPRRVHRP